MKKSMGPSVLACPSPVWCIGTYDEDSRPNVMTASAAGICCLNPPALMVSLRKATYSYHCIVNSKAFTVCIPSSKYAKEADYIGIASGKNTDKFKATGLTPKKSDKVNAPYVDEFPIVIECKLLHYHEIGSHTAFIGEIVDSKVDEDVLTEENKLNIEAVQPFTFSFSTFSYHRVGENVGKAFGMGKEYGS